MIIKYTDFLKNSISESENNNDLTKEDFDKVHKISELANYIIKNNNVYPTNTETIWNDIDKFRSCLIRTTKGAFAEQFKGIPYDEYKKTLNAYVKTKMYNKMVEIFYGKEFSKQSGFNPFDDNTEINLARPKSKSTSVPERMSGLSTTRGKYFKRYWNSVQKYTDNATEYLLNNGVISDVLGDVTEIGVTSLVAVILGTIAAPATGTTVAVGASTGGALGFTGRILSKFSELSQKYGKYFDIQKIKSLINKITQVYYSQIGDIIRSNGIIAGVLFIQDKISKEYNSGANFKDSFRSLRNPAEKQAQMRAIKEAIEGHSDFNNPLFWGSRPYSDEYFYQGLYAMPGWDKWSKNKNIKNPEEFEYAITYYISLYCYEFQVFCSTFWILEQSSKNLSSSK